ncbi:hypothetical protein [Haloplanus halobius]|uniref:hypothetical protein n=1 Tax=Haloplanus halobius TaxID=2934938 RepID=UPI00200E2491|nr:hypothetical protein [Haloplanus sp. XH21]
MEEYVDERHRFQRKPYWLFLDAQDELQWETFAYFPEAHYNREISKRIKEEWEQEILPDGGSRTQYYWSGEEGIVYHTDAGDEMVDPFFGSIEEAEHYLENLADRHGKEQYIGLVLRKSGNRKVEEATEVLTEQSGLADW